MAGAARQPNRTNGVDVTSQFSVNGALLNTSAPVGADAMEEAPASPAVERARDYPWRDSGWLDRRLRDQPAVSPVAIYRIFPSAWRVDDRGQPLSWSALAKQLVPYAADLGFTHVELLGFDPELCTQTTARTVENKHLCAETGSTPGNTCAVTDHTFAEFVDQCHEGGLGVILDWPLLGQNERRVKEVEGRGVEDKEIEHSAIEDIRVNALEELLPRIASYLDVFHLDGLRLELHPQLEPAGTGDTGRRDKLVQTLQNLVHSLTERFPTVMVLLENGLIDLGLDLPSSKRLLTWNTVWCENILAYLSEEPDIRADRHQNLVQGLNQAFDGNFVLPLADGRSSQGLSSWLERMPGDRWQRFANLRACLGFMCAHPGKKLLGMGTEFAQGRGWRYDARLDWELFSDPCNSGVFRLVADLNRLYVTEPALHLRDWGKDGFAWVVGDDTENSVVAFLRYGDEGMAPLLAVVNFKPVVHHAYRLGVPAMGVWRELINSDSKFYGGSNVGNASGVRAENIPSHGYPASLNLTIPPLGTLLLRQGDWPA
ncbi:MAG: hypothetical protein CL583_12385 [Alteromonadaceae bacterium]|nr:hypothetical protein [Alteromonadaceae bacterium]